MVAVKTRPRTTPCKIGPTIKAPTSALQLSTELIDAGCSGSGDEPSSKRVVIVLSADRLTTAFNLTFEPAFIFPFVSDLGLAHVPLLEGISPDVTAIGQLREDQHQQEEKFTAFRDAYSEAMKAFLAIPISKKKACKDALHALQSSATAFFDSFERLVVFGSLAGATTDKLWYRDKVETALNLLQTIHQHYKAIFTRAEALGEGRGPGPIHPQSCRLCNH